MADANNGIKKFAFSLLKIPELPVFLMLGILNALPAGASQHDADPQELRYLLTVAIAAFVLLVPTVGVRMREEYKGEQAAPGAQLIREQTASEAYRIREQIASEAHMKENKNKTMNGAVVIVEFINAVASGVFASLGADFLHSTNRPSELTVIIIFDLGVLTAMSALSALAFSLQLYVFAKKLKNLQSSRRSARVAPTSLYPH